MYNLSSLQVVPGAQQVPVGLQHLVGPIRRGRIVCHVNYHLNNR